MTARPWPGSRRRSEQGTTAVELVLYMPLLLAAILLAVQFSLVYLGKQVASATAREANRVARVSLNAPLGQQKGYEYAANIGHGVLDNVTVRVSQVGDSMRTEVSGEAQQLLPFFAPPRVQERVDGPVEEFKPDS